MLVGVHIQPYKINIKHARMYLREGKKQLFRRKGLTKKRKKTNCKKHMNY
jgi:hypothetical protein